MCQARHASLHRMNPQCSHWCISSVGFASEEYWALVHTPISLRAASKIPDAVKALTGEWEKLENQIAWDLNSVRERADVIADAKAAGRTVHFGSLMALMHIKHSALSPEKRKYKGRIVFRGDNVRDERGYLAAVF